MTYLLSNNGTFFQVGFVSTVEVNILLFCTETGTLEVQKWCVVGMLCFKIILSFWPVVHWILVKLLELAFSSRRFSQVLSQVCKEEITCLNAELSKMHPSFMAFSGNNNPHKQTCLWRSGIGVHSSICILCIHCALPSEFKNHIQELEWI